MLKHKETVQKTVSIEDVKTVLQFVLRKCTDMPAAENSGNSAISGIFSAFLQFGNPTNSAIYRSMHVALN